MEMRTEGPVEQAVRQALGRRCTLLTPGVGFPPKKQKEFTAAPDSDVVNISQITKQYVTWGILEGVVPYMLERDGIVEIGAKNSTNAKPDTLDSYLKSSYKVSLRTATYVAPILEKAGVVCYQSVAGRKAKHIRLLPPFAPGSGEYDRL